MESVYGKRKSMIIVFTLFLLVYGTIATDWIEVELEQEINWDLESTPLEIKTDSKLGKNGRIKMYFYDAADDIVGGFTLEFNTKMRYYIFYCTSWTSLPVTPPSTVEKVWRISLTRDSGKRLKIECNNVEVLNLLFSDSTCKEGPWSMRWNKDVQKIKFHKEDSASHGYRAGWIKVQRYKKIDWDMEKNSLQIKTNRKLGSGDKLQVNFYDTDGEKAGGVHLKFGEKLQYMIHYCSGWFDFPKTPSSATDKEWKISVLKGSGSRPIVRVIIHCNYVEVLKTKLTGKCTMGGWPKYWRDRDVEKIEFNSASDFYRRGDVCENGQYKSSSLTECVACAAGKELNGAKTACVSCTTGSYKSTGMTKCVACGTGKQPNSGKTTCVSCKTGEYKSSSMTSCQACAAGKQPNGAKTACVACENGQYKSSTMTVCVACAGGEEPNGDKTACVACENGQYKSTGMEKCVACEAGTEPNADKTACDGCKGLKNEWISSIKTTTKFPVVPGTEIKVECTKSESLNEGSSEVTCTSGTDFTHKKEPKCSAIGKNRFCASWRTTSSGTSPNADRRLKLQGTRACLR